MGEGGYKIRNPAEVHFITFAVVEWVDVFTRKDYRDIIVESIRYCQAISAEKEGISDVLRDFKKFTAKQIIKAIEVHPAESRKDWMLAIFRKAGSANSRNSSCQFWRQDNQPKELYSNWFTNQKLNYIHNNPVEAGIVDKAEEYLYSSARDYYYGKRVGLLQIDFL
ncbi:MAG: transposase [Terrimonas sp.]|nr:transposase [Terrimonas sp.]